MNNRYLMALAMNSNNGTLHLDNADIPVKIIEVESDNSPTASPMTTFKCLVVNENQIKYHNALQHRAKELLNSVYGANGMCDFRSDKTRFAIDRVIFKYPATIVIWKDGTKTVVKCQPGDVYSKETGLALCFAKKALGNKGNFNDVFHKWIPEEEKAVAPSNIEDSLSVTERSQILSEVMRKVFGGGLHD